MVIIVKNGYESMEDMRRMQQEAIMRVNEMQKRAKISLEGDQQCDTTTHINNNENSKKEPPPKIFPPLMPHQESFSPITAFSKNDVIGMFLKDSERSLILILVFLLIEENCDMFLIFALMYLVM
ncbi:MAG: hypothetical protein RUMPE_00163 [Eubacteriales bacterium SKADARSKE-1]|nr:hypothetical protein [Eubacteriales bacterium SKADARSKE-1]